MALTDIEARIMREAQAEADKILTEAKAVNADKLKKAQSQLAAAKKTMLEQEQKNLALAVEQKKQLLALEADQKILTQKRVYLAQILRDAEKEISADRAKLEAFYHKILTELQAQLGTAKLVETAETGEQALRKAMRDLNLSLEVKVHKDWPAGRLEINFGASRIDCSLGLYLTEQSKPLEAELAATLFGEGK